LHTANGHCSGRQAQKAKQSSRRGGLRRPALRGAAAARPRRSHGAK
jgi:hypothetical protein